MMEERRGGKGRLPVHQSVPKLQESRQEEYDYDGRRQDKQQVETSGKPSGSQVTRRETKEGMRF